MVGPVHDTQKDSENQSPINKLAHIMARKTLWIVYYFPTKQCGAEISFPKPPIDHNCQAVKFARMKISRIIGKVWMVSSNSMFLLVVYDLGQAPCHLLTSKVHNPWPCCRGGARRLRK